MLKKLILVVSNLIEPPFSNGIIIAGRYHVLHHLGTGSYGRSYLVYDRQLMRHVVLKSLRFHKRMTRKGRQGFTNEIHLLKKIDRLGFPGYHDSGVFKNIPFYTMEYIEGKNFEQLIFQEGNKYSEKEAFAIANKLLPLVEHLHDNHIIHRDIRIPNVILNGSEVWLIDLGLAVETFKKARKRQDDWRKKVNEQADFSAIGHFLLYLLYSNYSFPKGEKEKSWEEELKLTPRSKQIIRKLLQLEPPYQNCRQIAQDIEKLILAQEKTNVILQ